MANANFRGFLIIDGSKNTLLIPKEDVVNRFLSMDELITKNIDNAKHHKTQKELFEDVSKYLKCEYENGNGLHN